MRIAIAQINLLVGNIEDNKAKIIEYSKIAVQEHQADLIVFPELAITGYPPEDLLLRPALYEKIKLVLAEIISISEKINIIVGYPEKINNTILNACSLISKGKIFYNYYKRKLPNYGVFDEKRYFSPGNDVCIFKHDDINIALSICEDLWTPDHARECKEAGADLLININASPYHTDIAAERSDLLIKRSQETRMAIIYVNHVQGQDELVFDGGSMIINGESEFILKAPQFQEGLFITDVCRNNQRLQFKTTERLKKELTWVESIYNALLLGVRDYVNKNGFSGAVIGLSGGIDSALTCAIAVDALGSENVEVLLMPSRYTSDMSNEDAVQMSENLNIKHHIIGIEKPFQAFVDILEPIFNDYDVDTTEENIQARCRGLLLMAVSNKKGKIVLTTGNKSEMSVGYATLYGDMAGGFAPLKDISKTLVYNLAKWRNSQSQVIPQRIIDRPPSAELRPDQIDEDSLPPYDILDPILERYIELDQTPDEIIRSGFAKKDVIKVTRLVDKNEYKRRQSPPGVKISKRSFGRDRRYPITSGYKEL